MPEQHTPTAAPAAPLPPAPRHRGGVGEAAGWLGYGCISRQNFERRGRPSPRWFCRCGGAGWRAPPDTGARRLGHHAVHRTQGTRGTASTPVATDNVRAGPLYCLTRQCGLFCRTTCSHLQHRWCNSRGRGPMACLTHLSTMWSSAVGTPTALPPALPAPQYTATPHTTHPAHPAGRCAQAAETARSDWPVRPHPVVPVAMEPRGLFRPELVPAVALPTTVGGSAGSHACKMHRGHSSECCDVAAESDKHRRPTAIFADTSALCTL
uniref:Uncharacterized protein n=1 Tax=Lygus hesperus TaxID=30085 RepID=A0A146LX69_LYGHE